MRGFLDLFGFVVAALASMVIHLFGPVAHADVHPVVAGMAPATSSESGLIERHQTADHHDAHAAAGTDRDVAAHQQLSSGGGAHEDDGCSSLIRSPGSAAHHPLFTCVPATWQPRAEHTAVLPAAIVNFRSTGQLPTPGIQRI